MDTKAVVLPLPPEADLPPMLNGSASPRWSESLVNALHPLVACVLLLYLLPGLFSDPVAQQFVETCQLDAFIDSGL